MHLQPVGRGSGGRRNQGVKALPGQRLWNDDGFIGPRSGDRLHECRRSAEDFEVGRRR